MLCESSCLKKETWLSTRLSNSARFMKVLKGTARKSQINRKLMHWDNRPALLQSVIKHACTVDVVRHCRRNSAQHLAKNVLRAWKCIILPSPGSAGQYGNAAWTEMSILLTMTKPICSKRILIFMSSHKDPIWNSLHSESQHSRNQVENRHWGKMRRSTSWPFQESAEEGNDQQDESSQPGAYAGERLPTLGTADLQCKIGDTTHLLTFQVFDRQTTPILGPNDALRLNLAKPDKAVLKWILMLKIHSVSRSSQRVCWFVWWPVGESCSQINNKSGQKRHSSRETSKKDSSSHKKGQGRAGQRGEERCYCARDWTNRVGLTVGSHQKEERRRTDMSGSQRFKQSSQTTTSSHAYSRWCGLQTGENEGLFNVGCKGWILADQARKNNPLYIRTTFSTPYGRYRFLRMPIGINAASEVFQQAMERLFEGYPCAVIVDDIFI